MDSAPSTRGWNESRSTEAPEAQPFSIVSSNEETDNQYQVQNNKAP